MANGNSAIPGTLNVTWTDSSGQVRSASIADFGHYPLYSTATVAKAASAPLTYFNSPVGGPKPGAATVSNTRLDTNMTTSGQLDSYGEMLVYALRIEVTTSEGASATPTISSCILDDMNQLFAKVYSAFTTSTEKPLIEGPLALFPAGGGIYGVTTQNAAESWVNGQPQSIAGRQIQSPVFIPGLTNFRVDQQFLPAVALSTTRDLRITLDGLRKKAVQ